MLRIEVLGLLLQMCQSLDDVPAITKWFAIILKSPTFMGQNVVNPQLLAKIKWQAKKLKKKKK